MCSTDDAKPGATRSTASTSLVPSRSRMSSQVSPLDSAYGCHCPHTVTLCLPGGAIVSSNALNVMASAAGRSGGSPALNSPCALRSACRLGATSCIDRCVSAVPAAYCGSALVASRTTMPMPLPVRTLRRARVGQVARDAVAEQVEGREHVAAGDDGVGAGARRRVGAHAGGPPAAGRRSAAAPSPSRTRPPYDSSRACRASLSIPLPPLGWPGGRRCMTVFQPTRSAVATSCVGGPDCAPIQASAVLSRSSSKCSSSRLSALVRNCRDSSSPCRPVLLPTPHRVRPRCIPVGAPWKASKTRTLRADQSRTKAR